MNHEGINMAAKDKTQEEQNMELKLLVKESLVMTELCRYYEPGDAMRAYINSWQSRAKEALK